MRTVSRRTRLVAVLTTLAVVATVAGSTTRRSDHRRAAPGSAAPGSSVPGSPQSNAGPPGGLDPQTTATYAALKTGKPVEIQAARTATSETYANPSGTFTEVQHAMPVRVKRGDAWVPVDLTLRRDGGTVRPTASAVDVRFSAGGTQPLVVVAAGGVEYGLTWPEPLPAPRLSGDTATYPDVRPDVDLQIRALSGGFSKVLVVKNRAAAARLQSVHYGLNVRGGTVKSRPGGGMNIVDGKGTVVFATDAPVMWDDPQPPAGEPAHTATMPLTLTADGLTVAPDQAFLQDPATVYPVRIDPSVSKLDTYGWTHVNEANKDRSYWTSDRDAAKVGYSGWPGTPDYTRWRSFFLFDVSQWFGRTIVSAYFSIVLDHSGSCGPTQVDLWSVQNVSPSGPTTWNNTGGGGVLYQKMGDASGNANEAGGCGGGDQPDMTMLFGQDNVTNVARYAAAGAYGGTATFELIAPNESDKYQWKKFDPWSAKMVVEYNTPPTTPAELSTVPASTCGGSSTPTRLGASMLTPAFSAVLRDDDANLVHGELQILRGASDTLAYPLAPATTANTARIARDALAVWPSVPPGVLQAGVVYSYRARTNDGVTPGGWTNRCYFVIDDVGPSVPVVESTDYPDFTPVRNVGELGTVTFRNAPADADIAGYYYGFQADSLTGWVPADAEGDATVPITLWRNPNTGTPEAELYVQAEDRAGNRSPVSGPRMMLANDTGAVPPGKAGDVNGDGKGDVTALFDMGDDRLRAWTVTSNGTGFHTSYVGWDTGRDGSSFVTMRTVTGDFTGDGLADQALFRQDPDGRTRLYVLRSSGHRFDVLGEPVWTSPADPQWTLANLKVVAGNLDGTGADDIAALVNNGGNGWTVHVWTAASSFATDAVWYTQTTGSAWSATTAVAGDFDADGDADLATVADSGNGGLAIRYQASSGSAFGAPEVRYSSGANTFAYRRARFVAGNFDGDTTNGRGRTDIAALYEEDPGHARVFMFTAGATAFTRTQWWPSGGGIGDFDARTSGVIATDFTGDGRSDLAVFNDCCAAGNKELWTFPSTGTGFSAPQRVQELNVTDKPIARARWKLDAGSGVTAFDEYGDFPATTAGAPAWRAGRTGAPSDRALQFNGTQWAATSGPTVRTDRSFTVSAWVYLEDGGNWHGAVSQDGDLSSSFFLRYGSNGKWAFTLVASDTVNAPNTNLYSNRNAVLRQWTHLTGVYDAEAGEMRIYVNGVLDNAGPWSGGFQAYGPLNIGRDKYNGATWSTWVGGIDDVQIVDHVLSSYEIADLADAGPVLAPSGWQSSPSALTVDALDYLHTFARASNGTLAHWFAAPMSGWASDNLGGQLAGNPVAVQDAVGYLRVFAVGTDGQLKHWYAAWTVPWASGSLPGSYTGIPTTVVDTTGTLHVFVTGTNGRLQHWRAIPGGAFTQAADMGDPAITGSPTATVDGTGVVHVFAVGADATVKHWSAPRGGAWTAESFAGSYAGSPAAAVDRPGEVQVFVRGTNGHLMHWRAAPGAAWSGPQDMGTTTITGSPAMTVDALGYLHVFAIAGDATIRHWFAPPGGGWSQDTFPGSYTGTLSATCDAPGYLQVFAPGTNGHLQHWFSPSGGAWAGAQDMGSPNITP